MIYIVRIPRGIAAFLKWFNFSTESKAPDPQINNSSKPAEYFRLFYTNVTIENITLQANLFAKIYLNLLEQIRTTLHKLWK